MIMPGVGEDDRASNSRITNHLRTSADNMTSSSSYNTVAGNFANGLEHDPQFYLHGTKYTEYDSCTHQYTPPYQRYHQPYQTVRFDVPCNLTPPQPDKTPPYDLCCSGTPRYGQVAHNTALTHPEYDISSCNQTFYNHHSGIGIYRSGMNDTDTAVDASEYENCKVMTPSYTPPTTNQYEAAPTSVSTDNTRGVESPAINSPPISAQTQNAQITKPLYPWMKSQGGK